MGYTTTFEGRLNIVAADPDFDASNVIRELKLFLGMDFTQAWEAAKKKYNIHTRWCNWQLDYDVTRSDSIFLKWNGSEKSYCMYEWLHFINDEFLAPNGLSLEGFVRAQGEDPKDLWAIKVIDKKPTLMRPKVVWYPNILDDKFAV